MTTQSVNIRYANIRGSSTGYFVWIVILILVSAAGLLAAHTMESQGHVVTGMNNQVVWGMPHVFAIFLILTASGVLNVASVGSVFGKAEYKPFGRLSALLAVTFLIGGLMVLVLDLGRPDRLIVAMTTYNFKSIFAWNIFLYTGFMVVVVVYLWMMFERRMQVYSRMVGIAALTWRFILTTGTGSIFGFLVARQAYDAAILAPMFILMSLSFGTALFILVSGAISRFTEMMVPDAMMERLKRLLGLFVMAVVYFVIVYHLANLYIVEHQDFEKFVLLDGGVYTLLFWGVQILIGTIIPLVLVYLKKSAQRSIVHLAAALVIIGSFAQLYVLIIGGQAYPMSLFPGKQVSSSFYDGVIASYIPSMPEVLLGIGGVSTALLITTIAIRILPFLPERDADHIDAEPSASGESV
ncbi:MAG: Hdr menaquinol oxidoreductase integral membrane subunit [marine bacterium B5-7]|nr:MAG: Hdr menaquinol oxidoreductase integral membrane subunit [marine bacterium B5-7]